MISEDSINEMLDTAISTFDSAFDALSRAEGKEYTTLLDRKYIADSFLVNRLTKAFKDWEERNKRTYLDTEARSYNRQVGQMARLNSRIESLEGEYERVIQKNSLPSFVFSLQAVQQYENGALLKYLKQDGSGHYPLQVNTSDIFLLGENTNLMEPNFEVFNRLVNIEARIRIQKKIICEVLTHTKNQLASRNRKWTARDVSLLDFLETTLPGIFADIDKVRLEIQQEAERKENRDVDMENDSESEEQENNDEDDQLESRAESPSKVDMMDVNE